MDQLTDLPRNIVPEEFFERVLSSLETTGDILATIPDHALIHLEGAGGGTWMLAVREGRAVIERSEAPEPVLQISLRVSDWREFVAGRVLDEVQRHLSVNLLDPRTLRTLGLGRGHLGKVTALVFSGDGQTLCSAGQDGTIVVWTVDALLDGASDS